MFWKRTILHVLVAGSVACSTKDQVRSVKTSSSSSSSSLAKTSSAPATTVKSSSSIATSVSTTNSSATTTKSTSRPLPAAPTVTDTSRGVKYAGLYTVNDTVEKFLNIPYGADTSGANRFANPKAVSIARGTLVNASAEGPVCPQPAAPGPFPWNSVSTWFSEDCLRLKVARPAGTKAGAKLPVMVYIYGGSMYYGNINEVTNEPDGLVLQSVANGLPVVYVAMNYRLNVFGFAFNNALQSQKSANVGLKDQRLALQWVQDNIGYFGGDPDQVTIFGQSSGGLSATLQILAYGGRQGAPFQKAILQSTVLEPNMTGSITTETFNQVASLAGCASNGNVQGSATIQCLRKLSMDQLWSITDQVNTAYSASTNGDLWLPAVDGDFIPAAPSQLISQGRFTQMPIVAGWTRDDATGGTPFTIATDADTRTFISTFYPYLRPATLETLFGLYPVSDFTSRATDPNVFSAEFYRSAQIYRDIFFVCPSFYFGYAMAKEHSRSKGSIPVYYYELNQTIYEPYFDLAGLIGLGVIHESDFPYIFANFTPYQDIITTESASDYMLQKQMSRSWSAFAAKGAPSLGASSSTLQGWQSAYANTNGGMMTASVFAIGGPSPGMSSVLGPGGAVGAEKLAARCGFLNSADVIQQLKY